MISPGEHGGDGARLAAALGVDPGAVLDLSLSLNPVAPDVTEIVAKHLDALSRYPDPTAATAALASTIGMDPERVLLTNGGAEAIALVAAELGGGTVHEPEFSLHPRTGAAHRWRSNPNNPSGTLAAPHEYADVWDEAFYPIATGEWTRGDSNAVVVGSLTKVFACPGLRAGYVIAAPPLVQALADRQPAWSVNGLTCAALADVLATAEISRWAGEIAHLRAQLVALLRAHGFTPAPSDANWVLVSDAPGLRDQLARRGVLVRDCTNFGLADTVRIAVPDRGGLARLDEALS